MASDRQAAFSAVRWTTVSTLGKTGLQFLQVVVLARLLSPTDFGLMAIVVAVISLLQGISDLGVSTAIVHHQDATDRELSSLYWLNLGVALGLSLLIAAVSPLVAWFYGEPRLAGLLSLAGLSLTVSAAGQQLRIRAERKLAFGALAVIELVSAVTGFAVAATVAAMTASVFALVAGILASSCMLTLLSWARLASGWRPMLAFAWSDTRRFLSFGGYATLSNLVGMVNMQMDVAVGGRMFGGADLGAYSMARDLSLRLASVTNPIATRVGLPLMAMEHGNLSHVRKVYAHTLALLAAVNVPFYLGVAVFAPDVVAILFGPKWQAAAPLLRILALWGMLRSMLNPVGALLYACGRAAEAFRWNLSLTVLMVPMVVLGSQWGGLGLAFAQLVFMALVFVPAWKYLVQPDTGLSLASYLGCMARPSVLAMLAVALAWLAALPFSWPVARLLVALAAGTVAYGALSWRWNRSWLGALQGVLGRAR